MWTAQTAAEWEFSLSQFVVGDPLEKLLQNAFYLGSDPPPPMHSCLGTRMHFGPFARNVFLFTLLRGVMDFGEGKRKGGPVTQLWAVSPEALDMDPTCGLECSILRSYQRAFDRVSGVS